MCAPAEPVAAAPALAPSPTAMRGDAAGPIEALPRPQHTGGVQLRCKRGASNDTCAAPQQRQRISAAGADGSQGAESREGSDQQVGSPAERNSGRISGGRHSRQTGDSSAFDSTAAAMPETSAADTAAEVPLKRKRVMAGTGEVLAADMADSTPLLVSQAWGDLRGRLQRDGYLLLRDVLPASDVLKVLPLLLFRTLMPSLLLAGVVVVSSYAVRTALHASSEGIAERAVIFNVRARMNDKTTHRTVAGSHLSTGGIAQR